MNIKKDHFERNWLIVFLVLYVLIMIPFPWYYSTEYIAGPWGVPLYVFGWLAHGVVVLVLTVIYAKQCMKRPEYQNFEEEQNKEQENKGEINE